MTPPAPPPAPHTLRSLLRHPLWILGAAVFFLHLLVTPGHLLSPDEELLFRMSESLAEDRTTQILPLEADLTTGLLPPGMDPRACFATRYDARSGAYYAQYLPLQPLLAVPLLWAVRPIEESLAPGFARLLWPNMALLWVESLPEPQRSIGLFRRAVVAAFFNPFVAALTAMALARLGRLLTGNRRAGILAGALWAFGTVAWPHSRSFFTEPLAGLLALLAFDAFCRWYLVPLGQGVRWAGVAALFLALGCWVRVDGPFFVVGFTGAMLALAAWKYLQEEARACNPPVPWREVLLIGGLPLAAWGALQSFNAARFGLDLTSGYRDQSEGVQFTTPLLVGLHGLLLSPGKGLFFFSPAVLLGVWGWRRIAKGQRWVLVAAALCFLPFFIAMAKWQNWEGGWCWGPRHIVQVHVPLMLGAAFLFAGPYLGKRLLLAAPVAVVAVGVQLYGSSQSPLEYFREYFLTYRDLEYNRLAYRPNEEAAINEAFVIRFRDAEGREGEEVPPGQLSAHFPAPMVDSLYLPAHTQWAAYQRMWRLGFSDVLVLNVLLGRRPPDRWSSEP